MRFETDSSGTPLEGSLRYRTSDHAFDFIPARDVDVASRGGPGGTASLALGTLQLELGVATNAALYTWGYSPRAKWVARSPLEPKLTPAAVHIAPSSSLKPGVALDYPDAKLWSFFYDRKSGWVFFGGEAVVTSAIEIASNIGLVIVDGALRGIWLRPSFEP